MSEEKQIPDRITYAESRTINIGDYESVKCELRYSTTIRDINLDESTIEIMESQTVDSSPEELKFNANLDQAMKRVKLNLNKREAFIRSRTARFTDHDTESKGMLLMLTAIKAWKQLRQRVQVSMKMIDEMDKGTDIVFEDEE